MSYVGYWGIELIKEFSRRKGEELHVFTKDGDTIYIDQIVFDEGLSKQTYEFITSDYEVIEDLDII